MSNLRMGILSTTNIWKRNVIAKVAGTTTIGTIIPEKPDKARTFIVTIMTAKCITYIVYDAFDSINI